jgi:hypothetical protein
MRKGPNASLIRVNAARVRLVPGGPLPPERRDRLEAATRLYATARNGLDPEPLIERFATDVAYESQDVLDALTGRDRVAGYLRERWAFLRGLGRDTGRVEMGTVDLPEGRDHPCGILTVEGQRRSLAVLSLHADGLIRRLDFMTLVPPPSAARGTGEIPGLAAAGRAGP